MQQLLGLLGAIDRVLLGLLGLLGGEGVATAAMNRPDIVGPGCPMLSTGEWSGRGNVVLLGASSVEGLGAISRHLRKQGPHFHSRPSRPALSEAVGSEMGRS